MFAGDSIYCYLTPKKIKNIYKYDTTYDVIERKK